jgi:hypothetical protein
MPIEFHRRQVAGDSPGPAAFDEAPIRLETAAIHLARSSRDSRSKPMHGTLSCVSGSPVSTVLLRYRVRTAPEAWVLPEGTVPESVPHDRAVEHLRRVLSAWAAQSDRNVRVARNLAIRWLEDRPQIGVDPDVCLLDPAPPDAEELSSVCLWKPGHFAPPLCFEVVSAQHPYKDYATVQDRYAAMGTRELAVFDPLRAGPVGLGGPVALQLWRRDEGGVLERVMAADGPAYSEVLDAWLVPRKRLLEIADDPHGRALWLTAEDRAHAEKEHERAEKEHERAEKEKEQAARLELERRVAQLEKERR